MKQLKFDHDYALDIVEGRKSTTLRIDDKQIRVGERLQVVDKVSSNKPQLWEVPGEVVVVGVQEFTLDKMPLELLETTEIPNADREGLYAFLHRFYGDKVDADTIVKLITFEFKPYDQPVPFMIKQQVSNGEKIEKVKMFADGGSRGNPGPSASGFVIKNMNDEVIESWNKYLGITTNNQAEYHALVAGLEWCRQHNVREVFVHLDSLLAINQMKGIYKVKNRDLWTLYEAAKKIQSSFETITFTHVPRELNKEADAEVNKALDAVKGQDALQ